MNVVQGSALPVVAYHLATVNVPLRHLWPRRSMGWVYLHLPRSFCTGKFWPPKTPMAKFFVQQWQFWRDFQKVYPDQIVFEPCVISIRWQFYKFWGVSFREFFRCPVIRNFAWGYPDPADMSWIPGKRFSDPGRQISSWEDDLEHYQNFGTPYEGILEEKKLGT